MHKCSKKKKIARELATLNAGRGIAAEHRRGNFLGIQFRYHESQNRRRRRRRCHVLVIAVNT